MLFYSRPEEQLQPVVDTTSLLVLRPQLMEVVRQDHVMWLKDKEGEEERKTKRRKQQSPLPHGSQNPDNGQDPPGNCGAGGIGLPPNRFVF
ncbi:hypothetical protein L9F63_003933 [Diploptera punctata]|uniref:Uncharacterized protein n=1 Tax=Diploptera punctata TaxID=6984 RepID=A0AAD8E8B0_DIPPU|nr:hypothetical protein L9F63_003933 [Diploptera punctata]